MRRLLTLVSIPLALYAAGLLAYALGSGTSLVALVDDVRLEAATRGMLGAIVFPWFLAIAAQYFVDPIGDGTCLCCEGEACAAGLNVVMGAPASLAIALMIAMLIAVRPRRGLSRVWSAALIAGVATAALFHLTDHRLAAFKATECENHYCGG